MNNTHEDPQTLFAKQIEEEIKARFHRPIKSQFQMETLEDAQDSYKLVLADSPDGFKNADHNFWTDCQVTTMRLDVLQFWAEAFANRVLEKLLSNLRKSKNTIVLMMTPLTFSERHDNNSGKFANHISYRYDISEIGMEEKEG